MQIDFTFTFYCFLGDYISSVCITLKDISINMEHSNRKKKRVKKLVYLFCATDTTIINTVNVIYWTRHVESQEDGESVLLVTVFSRGTGGS